MKKSTLKTLYKLPPLNLMAFIGLFKYLFDFISQKAQNKFNLSMFFAFLLLNLCFFSSVSAKTQFVIKQIIPDTAGNLVLINGTGSQNIELKTIKLSAPERLVVDINNSMLLGESKKNIKISNKEIKDLRIAQFSSDPDVVRIVLTADSSETLKKIKIKKSNNTVLLDLNEINPVSKTETPLYEDRNISEPSEEVIQPEVELPINLDSNKNNNTKDPSLKEKENLIKSLQDKIDHSIIIKKIKNFDNRIIITGTGILSITEPIVLENPGRLAFDIKDSIVNSDDLLKPISLKNGDLLRIGQFDDTTVRVVIETQKPESYKTIISPDMQSIMITPENEISFLEFPDSDSIGEIQNIKIIAQDKKTTKIIINSAKPLIHNLRHNNSTFSDPTSELILSLYNVKQPKKEMISKLSSTGQFHGISFEKIEKYPNGSRWIFPLNRTTKIGSKLSLDGKVLELTFRDVIPVSTYKSNFKKCVVLDAGHGGQEPGAIRAGIYEKDLTIDITKKVKNYLRQAGINVIMTREEDESVSLKQRTIITNTENPDVFVSIHINSSENSSIRGLETYYYTPQSKNLAQNVQEKLANYINSPDRGIRTARFYVIRNTEIPAILTEVGFLSNDAERCSMLSEERKAATAKAIAEGIINYLKSK